MPDIETRLRMIGDSSSIENAYQRAGSAGRKFQTETSAITGEIKAGWIAVGGAVSALAAGPYFTDLAAKALQSEEAFRNTATAYKVNADEMIAKMRELTNYTVDESDLQQRAMKAMTGNIDSDNVLKIAEMSRLSARRVGESVGEALSGIADAVETGRTKALRAYGLLDKEQQKIIEAAKQEGIQVDITAVAWANYQKQLEAIGKPRTNAVERIDQRRAALAGTQRGHRQSRHRRRRLCHILRRLLFGPHRLPPGFYTEGHQRYTRREAGGPRQHHVHRLREEHHGPLRQTPRRRVPRGNRIRHPRRSLRHQERN